MGSPLHIRVMVGPDLLFLELVVKRLTQISADGQNWIYSGGSCSRAGSKEAFMAVSVCLGAKSFPELHFGG